MAEHVLANLAEQAPQIGLVALAEPAERHLPLDAENVGQDARHEPPPLRRQPHMGAPALDGALLDAHEPRAFQMAERADGVRLHGADALGQLALRYPVALPEDAQVVPGAPGDTVLGQRALEGGAHAEEA